MSLKPLNFILAILLLHKATASKAAKNLVEICYLPEGCEFIGKEKWDTDTFILCTELYSKIDIKTAQEKHKNCSHVHNFLQTNIVLDQQLNFQLLITENGARSFSMFR